MSEDTSTNEHLDRQAFDLLNAQARRASVETANALQAFRETSDAHAEALARAETLQALAPTLKYEKHNLKDSLWLWLDLRWARWRENPILLSTTAAVPLAVACLVAFQLLKTDTGAQHPPSAQMLPAIEYSTQWRETQEFTLSDGSVAWLDWQSAISVAFERGARRITVHRGKVAFDVVSDATRPFIVSAGAVTTEVTGTAFVVRFLTDSEVEVAVMEGQVRVATDAAEPAILNAAEVVSASGIVLNEITTRPSEDIGRWRDGLLVYRERPLEEVLQELASYTPFSIDMTLVGDSSAPITGVFYKDQAQDAIATVLEGQDLTFKQASNRLIIQSKPLSLPNFPKS